MLLLAVLGWIGKEMQSEIREIRAETRAIRREQDRRETAVASVELLRQESAQLRMISEERAQKLAVLDSRVQRLEALSRGGRHDSNFP